MSENKFVFDILSPKVKTTLCEQLDDLYVSLSALCEKRGLTMQQLLFVRIYLTDAANQMPIVREHKLYQDMLSKAAVSYIEQPLLDGSKVALNLFFLKEDNIQKEGTPDRMKVAFSEGKMLFHTVRHLSSQLQFHIGILKLGYYYPCTHQAIQKQLLRHHICHRSSNPAHHYIYCSV